MKRGKCPAQSTSAAVTDNWRCCRSFDSSRAFCFRTCVNPTFLLLLSSLSVFFFFLLLVRKETTRACTFSCPHSRVTLHTHSPAFISASSDPETRWNRMSPTREKKSKEADLVGLLRDRAQDPSTAVHPCLVQGQQSACAGYGCVHDEVVATMLRECSKETVGREARACMRRLEFVLHQSRPNFTSLNHRNSSVCAWQEHEHTHAHINGQAEKVMPSILPLSLSLFPREQAQPRSSHFVKIVGS